MQSEEKLGVIISTKDRPDEITRLLECLSGQEVKPAQIIVVDGGDAPVKDIASGIAGIAVDYIRKLPASLTAQRNAGVRMLKEDITLVAFLDDDVILEKDSLKNMMRFWANALLDVGGASFNNISVKYAGATFMEKVFCVNADRPCGVLRSGFQSRFRCLDRTTRVEWLVGCAMVYRKKIFKDFMFDEKFSGYARYEEVDFGYRVSRKYKLYVVSDARIAHPFPPENPAFSFELAKMETINRLYFVRKNPGLSVFLCYWGLIGILLNNIVMAIFRFDRRCLNRVRGSIAGLAGSLWKN